MKRKVLSILLAAAMVMSLTACGSKEAEAPAEAPKAEAEAPAEEAKPMAFCPNCGTKNNGSNFCGNCGTKLK